MGAYDRQCARQASIYKKLDGRKAMISEVRTSTHVLHVGEAITEFDAQFDEEHKRWVVVAKLANGNIVDVPDVMRVVYKC
jgi:hypothetical protein